MMRRALAAIDNNQAPHAMASMEDLIADTIAEPRFHTRLLGIFSLLALVLSAIGVYGVLASSVVERRREIGIRIALGADRSSVATMIVRRTLALAAIGVVLGTLGGLVLTRVLSTFLFNVTPTDPATFAAAAGALVLVALIAGLIPARKAELGGSPHLAAGRIGSTREPTDNEERSRTDIRRGRPRRERTALASNAVVPCLAAPHVFFVAPFLGSVSRTLRSLSALVSPTLTERSTLRMFEKSSVQSGVDRRDVRRSPARVATEAAEVAGVARDDHPFRRELADRRASRRVAGSRCQSAVSPRPARHAPEHRAERQVQVRDVQRDDAARREP